MTRSQVEFTLRFPSDLSNIDECHLMPETAFSDPIDWFSRWLDEARESGIIEPNAMALATVSSTGQPSARIVLLKEVDRKGFVFYTNTLSQKGQDLAQRPQAGLNFYW